MAASDNARSPRVLARARRAGLVVRTADLAGLCGLAGILVWLHVWGGRIPAVLAEAAHVALGSAVDPGRARGSLMDLGRQLIVPLSAFLGVVLLASLLACALQMVGAGRARSAGGRSSGLRLHSPFAWSESQRLQGLWVVFKTAILTLALAGLIAEALPALAGLVDSGPGHVARLFREIVAVWLHRLALVAVPIVVLDVVVQRYRFYLVAAQNAPGDGRQQRLEEGDPHVRAHIRRHARAHTRGERSQRLP